MRTLHPLLQNHDLQSDARTVSKIGPYHDVKSSYGWLTVFLDGGDSAIRDGSSIITAHFLLLSHH
jgi:hypothetical protein